MGQHGRRVPAAGPAGGSRRVTLSPRQISDLLTTHGLRPSRALGQNFVTDANTVRRIARLAEVGPGRPGARDRAGAGLADPGPGGDRRRGHRRRGRSAPAPGARGGGRPGRRPARPRRRHDHGLGRGARDRSPAGSWWPTCPTTSPPRWWPTSWTGCRPSSRMVIMVQREVGERLVARPGRPAVRGRLGEGRLLGRGVGGRLRAPHRVPAPTRRSDSALVSIRRRPAPAVDPATVDADDAVRAGPGRLRQAPQDAAAVAGRDWSRPAPSRRRRCKPDSRAENLDLDAWGRLAAAAAPAGRGRRRRAAESTSPMTSQGRGSPGRGARPS